MTMGMITRNKGIVIDQLYCCLTQTELANYETQTEGYLTNIKYVLPQMGHVLKQMNITVMKGRSGL